MESDGLGLIHTGSHYMVTYITIVFKGVKLAGMLPIKSKRCTPSKARLFY
jgi:hypothetical protein